MQVTEFQNQCLASFRKGSVNFPEPGICLADYVEARLKGDKVWVEIEEEYLGSGATVEEAYSQAKISRETGNSRHLCRLTNGASPVVFAMESGKV